MKGKLTKSSRVSEQDSSLGSRSDRHCDKRREELGGKEGEGKLWLKDESRIEDLEEFKRDNSRLGDSRASD